MDSELKLVDELRDRVVRYHGMIPRLLKSREEAQERSLEYLIEAEEALAPPLNRRSVIRCRLMLTRIEIELARASGARISFLLVASIVYMMAAIVWAAFASGLLELGNGAPSPSERLILGVPVPILLWSVVGSFTSMLIRAGHFPFSDQNEAFRWLLFRPIAGLVMGVLTYLMVVSGLIVFAGSADPQTPELLWIVAFAGSFSDTLSINLLQKVLGRFHPVEEPPGGRFQRKEIERNTGKVSENGVDSAEGRA